MVCSVKDKLHKTNVKVNTQTNSNTHTNASTHTQKGRKQDRPQKKLDKISIKGNKARAHEYASVCVCVCESSRVC